MATYVTVNLVFIAFILAIFRLYKAHNWLNIGITFIIISIVALHFEPIMIRAGLFTYDTDKILNIKIRNVVPIEDFMYVALASILVPTLWNKFDTTKPKNILTAKKKSAK